MTKIKRIKEMLAQLLELEMGSATTDKGIIYWEADLTEGVDIWVEDEEGNRVKAEDGDYNIDGRIIRVAEGKAVEILERGENNEEEPEVKPEDKPEETPEDQKPEEEEKPQSEEEEKPEETPEDEKPEDKPEEEEKAEEEPEQKEEEADKGIEALVEEIEALKADREAVKAEFESLKTELEALKAEIEALKSAPAAMSAHAEFDRMKGDKKGTLDRYGKAIADMRRR